MDKLSQNKQCEKAEKNIYVKINEMVRSNLLKFIAGKTNYQYVRQLGPGLGVNRIIIKSSKLLFSIFHPVS